MMEYTKNQVTALVVLNFQETSQIPNYAAAQSTHGGRTKSLREFLERIKTVRPHKWTVRTHKRSDRFLQVNADAQSLCAAARIHKRSKIKGILSRAAARNPHSTRTKLIKSVFQRFFYFWMTCTRPLVKNRSWEHGGCA